MLNGDPIGEGDSLLKGTVTLKAGEFKDITVNGYTFATNSGFPSTGFKNAIFTLNVPAGKTAADYTWTSSQPGWVSVDNTGKVTFNNDASSSTKTVKVVATPSTGQPLEFNFTINEWYESSGTTTVNWANAASTCTAKNMLMPSDAKMTNAVTHQAFGTRGTIGSLWPEWGNMGVFGWVVNAKYTWSSSKHFIDLYDGQIYTTSIDLESLRYIACYKTL
ncbi:hypothetical protein GV764_16215 [Atlantibacter hermannii]|nr:hypothetical protein [Atlantibacter hermannii]NBD00553.1 hypothetical protein [Atlantibacter hermannii]